MIADLVGRIRSLRQQPLLSAATIVTLGVGSAVCCVGVSLLDSILCNPLPYPEPDRLVVAWSVKIDEPDRVRPVSRRTFDEWKSTNRSFAQLAALRDWPFLMAGSSGPEQHRGASVSEEFLPILGAYMSAGRYLTPEDFGGSGADSAILSHRIWQVRFGADAAVIGRSVTLDNRSFTVVGVLGGHSRSFPGQIRTFGRPARWTPTKRRFRTGETSGLSVECETVSRSGRRKASCSLSPSATRSPRLMPTGISERVSYLSTSRS